MLASTLQKSGCSANPRAFNASGQTQHWRRAHPVCCADTHPEQPWRSWRNLALWVHWERLQVLQTHGRCKPITQTVLYATVCWKFCRNQESKTSCDVFVKLISQDWKKDRNSLCLWPFDNTCLTWGIVVPKMYNLSSFTHSCDVVPNIFSSAEHKICLQLFLSLHWKSMQSTCFKLHKGA